jgi:hypothetical protein
MVISSQSGKVVVLPYFFARIRDIFPEFYKKKLAKAGLWSNI